ncbi:hypothetical protein [Massilia sp. ST3]|uniref:hypothetical protein n=1 Tax=Massilia sp. ST3 TaxID=2824903 RepID=UPI001B82854E|nr:hypothetical protein [Massilia sp. ST3]MBQ5946947.1 hypothetical protein [Massilia sp. ST3]
MKTILMALGSLALLAGCAATPTESKPGEKVAYEDRYVPTGTLFSKKDPKRTDRTKVTSGEDLENMVRQSGSVLDPNARM